MKYKRLLAATLFAATTLTLTLQTFAAESMTETATEAVTESEREPIPAFETTDLDGNEVDETLFSKADLTIVNVWGTFCGPCINEMPELQAWSEELPDNVQLVGLIGDAMYDTSGQIAEDAKKILEATGVTYLQLMPEDVLGDIVFQIYAYPTTFFVDKEGVIVGNVIEGAYVDKYKDEVERLLSEMDLPEEATTEQVTE